MGIGMDPHFVGQKGVFQQMMGFVDIWHDEKVGIAVFDDLSVGVREDLVSNYIPLDGCFKVSLEPTWPRAK